MQGLEIMHLCNAQYFFYLYINEEIKNEEAFLSEVCEAAVYSAF